MDAICPIAPHPVEAWLIRAQQARAASRWTTRKAVVGGIALSAFLVAGCATVRPDFERRFHEGRSSHDLWMSLLATRYGCDTAGVVAATPRRGPRVSPPNLPPPTPKRGPRIGVPNVPAAPDPWIQVGMSACDAASLVSPEAVDAWVGPEGIHEEWKFRVDTGPLTSVYFEGRDLLALRVVPPVPRSAP